MVRFKRVAAVFDINHIHNKPCDESSGSDHSADLSDLVNSFLEQEIREQRDDDDHHGKIDVGEGDDHEIDGIDDDYFDLHDSLRRLFKNNNRDQDDDDVRRFLQDEVEKALLEVKIDSSMEFKRSLMARLRARGIDAGLCKSKWAKSGNIPAGNYEYIDVITTLSRNNGERYIVEVSLAGEFTIARPTTQYSSMLDTFPKIYIGKPNELKKLTRLMTNAIRRSMKSGELSMPPWRRLSYMHNKWFGAYKRTVSEVSSRDHSTASFGRRPVGFEMGFSSRLVVCRNGGGVGPLKGRGRVGNLALELRG